MNKDINLSLQGMLSTFLTALCCALLIFISPADAGDPESAYYSTTTDRIFWFIQISDIHIGTAGSDDTDNLTWIVNDAKNVINPEFIVASGDLVDATDGGAVPGDQSQAEWTSYHTIVTAAGMTADFYYDIPGNHDHYNDEFFAYFRNNSIQGLANDSTQVSWRKDFTFGSYHFLGINTAGNDGESFTIWPPPFGDNAGLDSTELSFITSELSTNNDTDLTLIFGHHPLPQRPTGNFEDTYISYGDADFIDLMEFYGVSVYTYGHTHQYREALLPTDNSPGVFDLNIDALGQNSPYTYQLFAIDCNGISTARQPAGTWPAVLITAPIDVKLGNDANPYAYSVNDLNPKPIRALVFDEAPVTTVQYRIDGGAWQSMTFVSGNLWSAQWDEPDTLNEEHTLEVQAIGSTTRSHTITVGVAETATPDPGDGGGGGGGCFIGSLLTSDFWRLDSRT